MEAEAYALLERGNLLIGECISFGNDRDKVDLSMESAHDLNIQRLQRVTGRLHEVDAGMHSVVHDVHPVHLVLCIQVCIEALLDILNDRSPRIIVIHEITKARGIHDSQAKANAVLFDIGADGLYADGLWRKVERRLLAFLWRV